VPPETDGFEIAHVQVVDHRIRYAVESRSPLHIVASLRPDLELLRPGGIGGQSGWEPGVIAPSRWLNHRAAIRSDLLADRGLSLPHRIAVANRGRRIAPCRRNWTLRRMLGDHLFRLIPALTVLPYTMPRRRTICSLVAPLPFTWRHGGRGTP
jgi:hypothetical protein